MVRHKPDSGGVRFSIYLDNRINDKIKMLAKGEGSSRNAIVNDILEQWFYESQDKPVTIGQKLERIRSLLENMPSPNKFAKPRSTP